MNGPDPRDDIIEPPAPWLHEALMDCSRLHNNSARETAMIQAVRNLLRSLEVEGIESPCISWCKDGTIRLAWFEDMRSLEFVIEQPNIVRGTKTFASGAKETLRTSGNLSQFGRKMIQWLYPKQHRTDIRGMLCELETDGR